MQDEFNPVDGALRERAIRQVALEELDAGNVIQIGALAGDERVRHAHTVAATHELLGQMRPDEARASSYQVIGHSPPVAISVHIRRGQESRSPQGRAQHRNVRKFYTGCRLLTASSLLAPQCGEWVEARSASCRDHAGGERDDASTSRR